MLVGDERGAGAGGHQVVREEDGERLVADDLARAPDGVAEAERLLLAHRGQHSGSEARAVERVERLAARLHRRLELVGDVEMVVERRLASAGDEDELLDPRLERFLDRVLDERAIDDGEHFLGDRLGGGEEAGAEAGDGEHRLA